MSHSCFMDEKEGDEFFDTNEELPPLLDSCQEESCVNLFDRDPLYQVWTRSPGSIQQRRTMFMHMMGLDHFRRRRPNSLDADDDQLVANDSVMADSDRSSSECGAVLMSSEWKEGSLMSYCFDEVSSSSEDKFPAAQFDSKIKSFDDDRMLLGVEEFGQVDSVRSFEPSSSDQEIMRRDDNSSDSKNDKTARKIMAEWLRRLGAVACIAAKKGHKFDSGFPDFDQSRGTRLRVRVFTYRKQSKELSAVYMGQKFLAHHGAILTMKFSPDGEYLASGGEDGVVRVWKVTECQRSNADDIPVDDPSCIYFGLNQYSELSLLSLDKEKMVYSKNLGRTSDSTFIVIPQELFQISEKPFYEFYGHNGDVLDLAWSKDKGLLSSSTDKTVRLWKLGCDKCIKIFPHNNYVTCIQFNPIDERYFISGSIDGKARVWEIAACRVVDWTDFRQIITAVCYRQDGMVLVVGSIMGDCRFYDLSENHLQLDAEVSFQGRKKSVDKRITGFQFCPSNHLKLMVTSADSTIRILDGIDVISKYKGFRNSGSRISAIFTSDGSRIISASEDSNVYMWNHSNQDYISSSNNAKSTWSSEHFSSSHVSIAIPWQGFSSKNLQLGGSHSSSPAYFSPLSGFTLWPEFFSEIAPKGSATWPEEKLPLSMHNSSVPCKSQLKFLKTSLQMSTSHAWGQVIVTAGCDGMIRSFQNFGLPVRL